MGGWSGGHVPRLGRCSGRCCDVAYSVVVMREQTALTIAASHEQKRSTINSAPLIMILLTAPLRVAGLEGAHRIHTHTHTYKLYPPSPSRSTLWQLALQQKLIRVICRKTFACRPTCKHSLLAPGHLLLHQTTFCP